MPGEMKANLLSQQTLVCLRNKAYKMRKETGDERWKAPIEKVQQSLPKTIGIAAVRPFQLLIFEPIVTCLCVFCAILLGVLYLFFRRYPAGPRNKLPLHVVGGRSCLQWPQHRNGLAACLSPIWGKIRNQLIAKRAETTGIADISEPEYRLPPTMVGAFFSPIGLFLFGWSCYPWVHWIVPIIGSAFFGTGYVCCSVFNHFPFGKPLSRRDAASRGICHLGKALAGFRPS